MLHDKYGVTATARVVYRPAQHLVHLRLVHPTSLRGCLENLGTVSTPDLNIRFHIIDLSRGRVNFQW